ncbi:flagellar basal body P-ring protein FlgI [Halothermothrix orenii]|uniref:Flagellar P-ring protein n=1 Tax=Halothermothrix orenii (strain H 168 / OCM 544 / DSM 9562) TaxID=373903 RepID=B8CYN5_HALOH|nr:flagellar basal body P-ring protein FlgI [Halothermothrix orenii]ACL70404.1 flagellar P-ring protein [Halothermothrix orenii H 168]
MTFAYRLRYLFQHILFLLIILLATLPAFALTTQDPLVSIGDITRIEGVRYNQLSGFGLVFGLAGTGDSSRFQPTIQSNANLLKHFGINVTPDQVRARNVAAVVVTAKLPPFAQPGDTIDITVSSIGDARSLQGGTLFMTPLKAPNGDVYAVAQGPLSIGGFNVRQGGNQVRQNHPTVARIPNGAIVERSVDMELNNEELTFILEQNNFETANFVAMAINQQFQFIPGVDKLARAINAREIEVTVPDEYRNNVVDFIAKINNLQVRAGTEARIIINERTGTVVFTHNVRISTVSVSHGNLTVTITSRENVSQPEPFTDGETEVTTETEIQVEEEEQHMMVIPRNARISDLVAALNAIGASPRDIIGIIQAIKRAGALHARVELI